MSNSRYQFDCSCESAILFNSKAKSDDEGVFFFFPQMAHAHTDGVCCESPEVALTRDLL